MPFVPLSEAVSEFLDAQDKPELLKEWVRETLGESWEDRAGEGVEEGSLLGQREHYGPDLPAGVCVVTAGVDVQDDRLELELLSWGVGEECWSLSYLAIRADPSTAVPWRELDDILLRPLRRVDGVELRVAAACIDSGGHFSQAVAAFPRERYGRRPPGRCGKQPSTSR